MREWHGLHRLERVGDSNRRAAEGGEEKGRRLPDGTGHRQQVARDDAGEGRAQDHGAGDAGGACAQGQRGVPQVLGHGAHRHLVGPHDDGQHEDGQREAPVMPA